MYYKFQCSIFIVFARYLKIERKNHKHVTVKDKHGKMKYNMGNNSELFIENEAIYTLFFKKYMYMYNIMSI